MTYVHWIGVAILIIWILAGVIAFVYTHTYIPMNKEGNK